jgi:selenide,water dikinase
MLAGGLEARLLPEALPLLPGALEKAQMGLIPGGSNRNMELYAPRVVGLENISGHLPTLLFDAQTSGGLLLAVSEVAADRFLEACHDAGFPHAARVGSFIEGPERIIL